MTPTHTMCATIPPKTLFGCVDRTSGIFGISQVTFPRPSKPPNPKQPFFFLSFSFFFFFSFALFSSEKKSEIVVFLDLRGFCGRSSSRFRPFQLSASRERDCSGYFGILFGVDSQKLRESLENLVERGMRF